MKNCVHNISALASLGIGQLGLWMVHASLKNHSECLMQLFNSILKKNDSVFLSMLNTGTKTRGTARASPVLCALEQD